METFQHGFSLHQAFFPLAPPAPAHGSPSLLTLSTSLRHSSPRELHVVVAIPNTLEIMVLSPDEKPMEGLEDHLGDEDDSEEDQKIDEVGKEQQIDHGIDEAVGGQQKDQEITEVESGASDNSFDSVEEREDVSNPDYDPSRDR